MFSAIVAERYTPILDISATKWHAQFHDQYFVAF